MIYVSVLHFSKGEPRSQVFVSLDGDSYLPVTRMPEAGEEEAVAAAFEPDPDPDNPKMMTLQMRYARRALDPSWWPNGLVTKAEHLTIN